MPVFKTYNRKDKHKLYRQVIEYAGPRNQIDMVKEELDELSAAINKYYRNRITRNQVIEEIADVLIMIDQLKIILEIGDEAVSSHIQAKLRRLDERLTDGTLK